MTAQPICFPLFCMVVCRRGASRVHRRVILNSWVWFFPLAVAGKLIARTRIGPVRHWLNRVSAVIIWLSAAYWVYNLARIA